MKTIVTHIAPDLDAITSTWLIKKFYPGWALARVTFVPAGTTLDGKDPDLDPDIIHTDTGLGKFDHHQLDEYTSATKIIYEFLLDKEFIPKKIRTPLKRITEFVNDIDHFAEVHFPDPDSDRYDFCLHQIILGLRVTLGDDHEVVKATFTLLDAALQLLSIKTSAELELEKGMTTQTRYGKTLILETKNQEAGKLALKKGYSCVITKDPERGYVRIKTLPDKTLDLTPVYQKILSLDKKGSWFLHISRNMLLNASSKNPHFIPTPITIAQLVSIIKGV